MRIQVQRKHHGKSAAKAFVALDTYLSSVANPIVCDDTLIRSFMANLLLGLEPANPIGDPQGTPHGGLAFSSHLSVVRDSGYLRSQVTPDTSGRSLRGPRGSWGREPARRYANSDSDLRGVGGEE